MIAWGPSYFHQSLWVMFLFIELHRLIFGLVTGKDTMWLINSLKVCCLVECAHLFVPLIVIPDVVMEMHSFSLLWTQGPSSFKVYHNPLLAFSIRHMWREDNWALIYMCVYTYIYILKWVAKSKEYLMVEWHVPLLQYVKILYQEKTLCWTFDLWGSQKSILKLLILS